jgi:hypothetical protein
MSGWGLAGAIASCILLTAAAPDSAPAAAQSARPAPLPCRPGFTSIRMISLASGHHAVTVVLNGKPGAFLVDTGAGATVIHTPYLQRFALTSGPAIGVAAVASGRMQLDPVKVDAFTVGGTKTRLHQMYAMDLSYIVDAVNAGSPQPVQGLIGQDVLRDQKALIDVDQSILYLADPDSKGCGAKPKAS